MRMGEVNTPERNKHDLLNSESQQDLLLDPQNEMQAKEEEICSGVEFRRKFDLWIQDREQFIEEEIANQGDDPVVARKRTLKLIQEIYESLKRSMDSAIAKSEIPEDVILYRSCGTTVAKILLAEGKMIEKGYSSTSLNFLSSIKFGRRTEDGYLNILVMSRKKGQRGLYIDEKEHEVILPRDAEFILLGVREADEVKVKETDYIAKKIRFLFVKVNGI